MDKKVKKVVIDTNIFTEGFLDFVSGKKSADADIIRAMLKRDFILVLSKELEGQIIFQSFFKPFCQPLGIT
jgi:predicted nucleic acid-binding protein